MISDNLPRMNPAAHTTLPVSSENIPFSVRVVVIVPSLDLPVPASHHFSHSQNEKAIRERHHMDNDLAGLTEQLKVVKDRVRPTLMAPTAHLDQPYRGRLFRRPRRTPEWDGMLADFVRGRGKIT
jgi:hypothetical protein